jgi:hypothetical protein
MRAKIIIPFALISLGLPPTTWATSASTPAPSYQGPDTQAVQAGSTREPVVPVVASRGQLLYENHCSSCHECAVHAHDSKRLRSLSELRGVVWRWAEQSRLRWKEEDVEDVVRFLNSRYYQFESR